MIEKYESRRIRVEIRRVLVEVWDPIGIKHNPEARDEYDAYIGEVYELLIGGSPDRELAEFLFAMAHDHMGLDRATLEDMGATVKALKGIKVITGDSTDHYQ